MKHKRLLSLLLCVAMIMSFMVTTSFAESTKETAVPSVETSDNDLSITKSVTDNGDGTYNLTMEAYASGKAEVITKSVPLDIVLVLDQSGSMAYDFNGASTSNNSSRRQYAMKQAVNNFINSVNEKYDVDKADHRMAVVTFDSNASLLNGWIPVDNAGKTTMQNKISNLDDTPSGATNVADGMKQAETLMGSGYNYSGSNTARQKVVVVFTDGVPTTSSAFSTTVATNAIKSAKTLKDAGVTVYSVGIFNGADPGQLYGDKWDYTLSADIPCNGNVGSYWGGSWVSSMVGSNDFEGIDIAAGNRFLNYISSNFKDADEIGVNRGSYAPGGHSGLAAGDGYKITKNFDRTSSDYYMTAENADQLNNAFQQIADEAISSAATADATSILTDDLSTYFNFKLNEDETFTSYSVKQAPCTGENTWGEEQDVSGVTVTQNGKNIDITGFNYTSDENMVVKAADGWKGNKLVVTFTIVPNADANWQTGTHCYPTNQTAENKAGIYAADGTEMLALNQSPTVPMTAATVSYQVTGAAPATSSDLPEDAVYLKGANVSVAPALTTTETTKDGKQGTWSFDGWDKTDDFAMTAEDVEITGTWSFVYTETKNVTMTKVWEDDNDRDGVRPDSISVQLLDNMNNEIGDAVTVTANDSWAHTWNVPMFDANGNPIAYHVVERNVDNHYRTLTGDNGVTITNIHELEKVDVTVTKDWDDADNQDGIRPENISVQLKANGTAVGQPVTITADPTGVWTYTWENQFKNENGQPINYTVEEVNVAEGYTATYGTEELTITNTHVPATIEKLTMTKIWDDDNNRDGIRPESIDVKLLANGEPCGRVEKVTAADNWTYTWNNLPVYENGQEIAYTVEEVDVARGYESSVDGMTITNTHEPEVVTIPVVKDWVGDTEAARPESITVNLLVDGEVVKTIKLTADNQWTGAFENVPVYANGEAIEYDVEEVAVDGYTASYNITENGVAVINTLIPVVDPEPTPTPTPDPVPAPAPVPATGDSSNMVLYVVLAVLALAAIAVAVIVPMKKRS